MTAEMWHVTHDMVQIDMWRMVGGEHYLKMSAPQLLRFEMDSVLKILNKKDHLINESINYKGVYGTALATTSLLITTF